MTREAADQGALSPWLKPGTLAPAPEADAPETPEEALKSLLGKRKVTYRKRMAEAGIEPGDKRHNSSLDWAMMWLREHRPFYAYCFSEIIRRECYEIPTLAVTCRRGRVELLYNPDFLAIHGLRHNVGFVQHELGHIIHGHLSDGQKRPDLYRDPLVNVAMDLAVDSLIQSEGDQPDWVLMPSKLRMPKAGVPPEKWQNFPERATWERYYELLKQMRDEFPEQFQQQVVIRIHAPVDDEGNQVSGDSHDMWQDGKGDCDHPDVVDEVVRQLVRQAWETTQSREGGRGRGTIPGSVAELVEELLGKASVPFTRLFRAFVASRFDVSRRVAVNKVSRRRSTIPGSRSSKKLRVLWCRDTSGSVGSEELAVSYNELYEMKRQTGVSVAVQDFDHGLQGPLLDLDAVSVKKAAEFRGRGGTEFSEPLKLAAQMRPDVCIITTDGYAPFPDPPPGVPVMWLITHNGAKPPWGMVIRLPDKKEIARGHKAAVERWLGKADDGSSSKK
jgi:predicted metal-dependent peptidase